MIKNSFILTNAKGLQVELSNYGARILSIQYPLNDVLIPLHELSEGKQTTSMIGATLGYNTTYINRTSYTEQVTPNSNFHLRVWDVKEYNDEFVVFELNQQDHEAHRYKVFVTYMLTMDNAILVQWEMKADKDMHINISLQPHFNLDGGGDLMSHRFKIYGNKEITIQNDRPTEEHIIDYPDSVYSIDNILESDQKPRFFIFDNSEQRMILAAVAESEKTGLKLECFTTQAGLYFNTIENRYFCFGTQNYSGASHSLTSQPNTLVPAHIGYKEQCLYRFGLKTAEFNPFA